MLLNCFQFLQIPQSLFHLNCAIRISDCSAEIFLKFYLHIIIHRIKLKTLINSGLLNLLLIPFFAVSAILPVVYFPVLELIAFLDNLNLPDLGSVPISFTLNLSPSFTYSFQCFQSLPAYFTDMNQSLFARQKFYKCTKWHN